MVPRDRATEHARARAERPGGGAFTAWRRWLTKVIRGAEAAARRIARAVVVSARFLRDPRAFPAAGDPDRAALAAAGVVALLAGATAGLAISASLGEPLRGALSSTVWTLGWCLARLLVLTVASPLRRSDVRAVWAASLLPFALALTSLLGLAALVVSGWLTYHALQAAGSSRRDAAEATAWACGGQALAELLRWAALGLLFLASLVARG